jgi:hypothetical protein
MILFSGISPARSLRRKSVNSDLEDEVAQETEYVREIYRGLDL